MNYNKYLLEYQKYIGKNGKTKYKFDSPEERQAYIDYRRASKEFHGKDIYGKKFDFTSEEKKKYRKFDRENFLNLAKKENGGIDNVKSNTDNIKEIIARRDKAIEDKKKKEEEIKRQKEAEESERRLNNEMAKQGQNTKNKLKKASIIGGTAVAAGIAGKIVFDRIQYNKYKKRHPNITFSQWKQLKKQNRLNESFLDGYYDALNYYL